MEQEHEPSPLYLAVREGLGAGPGPGLRDVGLGRQWRVSVGRIGYKTTLPTDAPFLWLPFVAGKLPSMTPHASMPATTKTLSRESDGGSDRLCGPALRKPPQLAEDELGAGQVEECKVVLHLLLPAHQQPPRPVQPAVRPLHHPPSWLAALGVWLAPLFAAGQRDVDLVASIRRLFPARVVVVPPVHAGVLAGVLARLRAWHHRRIERHLQQHLVVAVGASHHDRERDAPAVGQQAALGPLLAAISRVGPGRGAPERGLGHRPIYRLPLPVDALELVVLHQARPPQLLEEAARLPFLEAAVRGAAAAARLLGQCVPLHPSPQHAEDGAEAGAVIDARAASPQAGQLWRNVRLDACPEGIADFPGTSTHGGLLARSVGWRTWVAYSTRSWTRGIRS